MKVKVAKIKEDWRNDYLLEYASPVYAPQYGDYLIGIGKDHQGLVDVLVENGLDLGEIGNIFQRLAEDGEVEVNILVDDPELDESNITTGLIQQYEDCGYVYDNEGNPVEIDAPDSPLRELGLV